MSADGHEALSAGGAVLKDIDRIAALAADAEAPNARVPKSLAGPKGRD
jgi:hypothetical protein